jgi:hypothetical protein
VLLLLILAGGCTPSQPAQAPIQSSPATGVRTFPGGCAGTVLTNAEPPAWAQGGWNRAKGALWPVRWALGTNSTAVAYVFAGQLVAGTGPRVDGSQNKVLWVAKDHPTGEGLLVEGRPAGLSQPVVAIAGGPSITDVPTPGCWTFALSWSSNGKHSSTINLEVLPAGTNPMTFAR